MKVIYSAKVIPVSSGYCLSEIERKDGSEEWDGNVSQYVFDRLDYSFACSSVNSEYDGKIYDLPEKAIVLSLNYIPVIAYWCEEER